MEREIRKIKRREEEKKEEGEIEIWRNTVGIIISSSSTYHSTAG